MCFGDQEKKVGKSSCFGVPLFGGLVMPDFQGIKSENVSPSSWNYLSIQCSPCLMMGRVFRAYGVLHERLPKKNS